MKMKHINSYNEHINEEFGFQEIGLIILSGVVGTAAVVVLGSIFLDNVVSPILDLFENKRDKLKFMKMINILKNHKKDKDFVKFLLKAAKLIGHGEIKASAQEIENQHKEEENKELLFNELDKVLTNKESKFFKDNYYLIDELYNKNKNVIDEIVQIS
jgi:hypothetical protein